MFYLMGINHEQNRAHDTCVSGGSILGAAWVFAWVSSGQGAPQSGTAPRLLHLVLYKVV